MQKIKMFLVILGVCLGVMLALIVAMVGLLFLWPFVIAACLIAFIEWSFRQSGLDLP